MYETYPFDRTRLSFEETICPCQAVSQSRLTRSAPPWDRDRLLNGANVAKRLDRCAVFALFALSLGACAHPSSSAGADPGSANNGQSSMPWASNAGDVARFADEVPFGPEATVAQDKTPVHNTPGGGDLVATLPMGAEVTKLAARGNEDLVCFDDPKPGGAHLMGWVAQSALHDAAPSPGPGPAPNGQEDADVPPPSPNPPPPHGGGGGHHHHGRKKHPQQQPQ